MEFPVKRGRRATKAIRENLVPGANAAARATKVTAASKACPDSTHLVRLAPTGCHCPAAAGGPPRRLCLRGCDGGWSSTRRTTTSPPDTCTIEAIYNLFSYCDYVSIVQCQLI